MDRSVTLRSASGRLVAVKTAGNSTEAAKLGHEAELLRRSAHPGVVAVVSFSSSPDGAELILTAPSEHTVSDQLPRSLRDCLDFVAAIAGIVADLHALGVAHCAIRPDHVLVAPRDQPVLCGFGDAQSVVDPQLFSADVLAIGELLAWLARRMPPDPRNARKVANIVALSRRSNATARELAFALAAGHRDPAASRLPTVARRPAMVALLGLAAIATGVARFTGDKSSPAVAPVATAPNNRSTTPDLVSPDAPLVEISGMSYRVGQPGDLAYFVPCGDEPRVVVLRPDTGDIFVFSHLAEPGTPHTAQSVGRVAGAQEILAGEDVDCSQLSVVKEGALLHIPIPTSTRSTR